ncbi:unnamed protein product [Closterium sp. Naga37s-1]|nr:unnamed protein product [Closterium sp. Naga37s-1]
MSRTRHSIRGNASAARRTGPPKDTVVMIAIAKAGRAGSMPPSPSSRTRMSTTCGALEYYDKTFDQFNPKSERPLERCETRQLHKVTMSDDPVVKRLAAEGGDAPAVFATDAILSTLMCAPRSVYSGDVVVPKSGGEMFFNQRDSSFHLLTVSGSGVFDSAAFGVNYPLREFNLPACAGNFFFNAAKLSLVGSTVGALGRLASDAILSAVSKGGGAVSKHELDRMLLQHFNHIPVAVLGTTALRCSNVQLGEPYVAGDGS